MENKVYCHCQSDPNDLAEWLTKHPDIEILTGMGNYNHFYIFYRQKLEKDEATTN